MSKSIFHLHREQTHHLQYLGILLRLSMALILSIAVHPQVANGQQQCEGDCLFHLAQDGDLSALMAIPKAVILEEVNALEQSLLFEAVFHGHLSLTDSLLKSGLDPNKTDSFGATPLMYAASQGYPEIVGLLLQSGANPNLHDQHFGWTALMYACFEGDHESAELLLSHGADIELSMDQNGDTALMKAAYKGFDNVVLLLVEAGADCEARNKLGYCAADLAEMGGHHQMTKMLKSQMNQ